MDDLADDQSVSQPPPPRDPHGGNEPWAAPHLAYQGPLPGGGHAPEAFSPPAGHPGSTPPPPGRAPDPSLPLADRVPGAVAHDVYSGAGASWPPTAPPDPSQLRGIDGLPPLSPPPTPRPSGWNAPAFGMLAIFLLALTALLWPQYRARATERKVKPMVAALAQRDAGARCPRYITSIFTNVGSVSLDSSGEISDHTDLTGPICDGLRRLYTPAGQAEMNCLITDGNCSPSALRSVVALSVVAHESMHLRGILDEAAAECASIGEGVRGAQLAGLTAEHGRMIAWAHYTALNPNTPEQYSVSLETCPGISDLERMPPGTEASRGLLTTLAERTWLTLGEG